MGWFNGNSSAINTETLKRHMEVRGIYQGLAAIGAESAARSLKITRDLTQKSLGLQKVAQDAKVEQVRTGLDRATKAGFAQAGTDPLQTADVAGRSASDTTFANVAARGAQERIGLLQRQSQAEVGIEDMKTNVETTSALKDAETLAQLQEQPNMGYGGELLQFAGLVGGFKMGQGRFPWQAKTQPWKGVPYKAPQA